MKTLWKGWPVLTCGILLLVAVAWFVRVIMEPDSPWPPRAVSTTPNAKVPIPDACGPGCGHVLDQATEPSGRQVSPQELREMVTRAQSFTDWHNGYVGDQSVGDEILERGMVLARERREAMADLIQADPDEALRQALGYEEYATLPAEIQNLVERPFSALADLDVRIGCSDTTSQYHHELVDAQGQRWALSMPKDHRAGLSKLNLPVQGIALNGHAIIHGRAFQALEGPDAAFVSREWPAGQTDMTIDFVTGNPIVGDGVIAVAGGMVFSFQDNTSLDHINRVMAEADARPGVDNGSSRLLLAANEGELIQFEEEEFVKATVEAAYPPTTGAKTALFIIVNFPDDLTNPDPSNLLESRVDGEVNDALQRYSYGQTSMDATVAGTYTLPFNKSFYTYSDSTVYMHAVDAHIAAGNPDPQTNYDTVCVVFTNLGFPFGGMAQLDGHKMWLQNTISAETILHEFGHNFGLRHGNLWVPSNSDPVDPGGSSDEYGNYFDVMGAGAMEDGHFTPGPKAFLGWIPSSDWEDLSGQGDSGSYRVYRFDHEDSTGTRGLRIAKSASSDHYWIGYRRDYQANPYFANGAVLHWERGDGTPEKNHCWLVDTTPGSSDGRNDAAIALGRTYSDTASNVHITAIATGGTSPNEYIDVAVHFGPFPSNNVPTGTLIGDTAVNARQAILFNVEAVDADGDALAYQWDMGDGRIMPNAASVVHSWAEGGSYDVEVTISDMKGGAVTLHQTVTVADDMNNWTTRTSGTTNTLHSIASDSISAVAVGNAVILRSTDGVSWTDVSPSSFSSVELHDVCWTGTDFVAVGEDHVPPSAGWYSNVVYTSSDGVNWSLAYRKNWIQPVTLRGVVSDGAGVVVAVGDKGTMIRRLNEGSWSEVSSGISSSVYLLDIAHGEGTFVVVGNPGYNGTPSIWNSPNGLNWTDQSGGANLPWSYSNFSTIDHSGEHFLASGFFTKECHSLDQGQTWGSNQLSDMNELEAYAVSGSIVYAVGVDRSGSSEVDIDMVSTDGLSWTTIDPGSVPDRNGLALFADTFISVGESGSIRQSGFVGGSNYSGFANTYFPGGGNEALPDSNGDGDWANNLIEYALGGDPGSSASAPTPPTLSFDGSGDPVFEVSRDTRRSDLAYSVWWSTDLSNWTRQGLTIETDDDTTLRVVADGQSPVEGKGFFRLELLQR